MKKRDKHATKRPIKHIQIFVFAVAILSIASIFYVLSHTSNTETDSTLPRKAAIVDHLSISAPNQSFVITSTTMLEAAGFEVDYYRGEDVTVDFYRNLAAHDYGLLVLRVHSGVGQISGTVILYTSENYSDTTYVYEQLKGQLVKVCIQKGGPAYFGITPNFVRECMRGRFKNTLIILMGCDGLKKNDMAKAFIEKGAKLFVSWNGPVMPDHTDKITTHVLLNLLAKNQTIENAVTKTMREVGPDPTYKSSLLFYPLEAGDYTLPKERYNSKS